MKTNLGIDPKKLEKVVRILSRLLADEFVLYTKTRNFHWNVTGLQFNDLHKMFEAQYNELNVVVDDVAERIRALGAPSPATLAEFLEAARLKEQPRKYPEASRMLAVLLEDHEALVRNLREDAETAMDCGDAGTNDFLVGLMEQHEKTAWMLRAFLQKGAASDRTAEA